MVGRCIPYWNGPLFRGHISFRGCILLKFLKTWAYLSHRIHLRNSVNFHGHLGSGVRLIRKKLGESSNQDQLLGVEMEGEPMFQWKFSRWEEQYLPLLYQMFMSFPFLSTAFDHKSSTSYHEKTSTSSRCEKSVKRIKFVQWDLGDFCREEIALILAFWRWLWMFNPFDKICSSKWVSSSQNFSVDIWNHPVLQCKNWSDLDTVVNKQKPASRSPVRCWDCK